MSPDLQVLADNRDALLLAEVAAWLHDIGKLAQIHVSHHTNGPLRWGNGGSYKVVVSNPVTVTKPSCSQSQLQSRLGRRLRQIISNSSPTFFTYLQRLDASKANEWENLLTCFRITIHAEWDIASLIMLGLPGAAKPADILACFGKDGWLPAALGICHGHAHHDKQDGDGPQQWPQVYVASAFGWEQQGGSWGSDLMNFPTNPTWCSARDYRAFWAGTRDFAHQAFVKGLGDTRRPVNEVTLQDWGWTVAALYKSVVAHALLMQPASITDKNTHNLSWRLLSIRTDGLAYLFGALSIPDLLARKALLADGWNRVQTLLEETYPLGLEVYRDENGAAFVVPDIANLTGAATDPHGKTLRECILEAFLQATVKDDPCLSIQGEIVPELLLDTQPWKGQPAPQELPPIGGHIEATPPLTSDPIRVRQHWCSHQADVCTVCGLRPQGPSQKAKDRNVCDICEQRRADRAREWALEKRHTTIWTDEVADVHGRLALVVGYFDLTHWLSGDLVRTLAVRDPGNVQNRTADAVAKNPSFARLRRIWETTRTFWQEVAPTDDDTKLPASQAGQSIDQGEPRLEIKGDLHPENSSDNPDPYHAYELVLDRGVKMSAVWDANNRRFITCDNLQYLAGEGQLGKPVQEVLKAGSTVVIEKPVGYGARDKVWGAITLAHDAQEIPDSAYTPVIPILAEPRIFMALVPANKALAVVQAIKAKYEREMGKVRNRLPLHLGVVYAHRRLPLRAVLDAGRRMLRQEASPCGWRVAEVHKRSLNNGDTLPKRFQNDAQGQFAEWYEVDLEKDGHRLTWYVPAVMGDGQTEDHWYPYVFLASPDEPTGRNRYYKTDAGNPWKPIHPWLIHAGELQAGDAVYFTPATLDFIWLDAGGRRFEVAYDEQGRRRDLPRRPYLLDELETLDAIWETLRTHLTNNQIYALNELIEKRREEWKIQKEDSVTDTEAETDTCTDATDANGKETQQNNAQKEDPTFLQFCRDALANAAWRSRPWNHDREAWLDRWADYALRGWLADVVELHMAIMKENAIVQEPTPQETAQ